MASKRYSVVIRDVRGSLRKVVRLVLGPDGSYYMTCPYHESGKVALTKRSVNFADPNKYSSTPPLEVGVLNDDEHRVKLTHHPDGWLQFSGTGIVSGRNNDGSAKGLGIQTWPLSRPTAGPACALTVMNVTAFQDVPSVPRDGVLFDSSDMLLAEHDTGYVVEAYYFAAHWRRFVKRTTQGLELPYVHPSGGMLHLRVLPGVGSLNGFLGVDVYPAPIHFKGTNSGFAMSSPTGNMRYNDSDDLLEAEAIYAMFPAAVTEQAGSIPLQLAFLPRDDPPYKKGKPPPNAMQRLVQDEYNERLRPKRD